MDPLVCRSDYIYDNMNIILSYENVRKCGNGYFSKIILNYIQCILSNVSDYKNKGYHISIYRASAIGRLYYTYLGQWSVLCKLLLTKSTIQC